MALELIESKSQTLSDERALAALMASKFDEVKNLRIKFVENFDLGSIAKNIEELSDKGFFNIKHTDNEIIDYYFMKSLSKTYKDDKDFLALVRKVYLPKPKKVNFGKSGVSKIRLTQTDKKLIINTPILEYEFDGVFTDKFDFTGFLGSLKLIFRVDTFYRFELWDNKHLMIRPLILKGVDDVSYKDPIGDLILVD